MKAYQVLRQHLGDKQYMPGDTREANPSDVKHLVDAGVLKEAKVAASKTEKAPANKAEGASTKNKSE
ncbi:hypothetical protein GOL24_24665 [Sinorhizobium medicae]|nr:hypothetical protein [Sinorhizobium medicae]MDX1170240.1 hypothetical protein [Sinorhizobium medicae]